MRMLHWLRGLLIPKQHKAEPCEGCAEHAARLHRLEIAHNELREKLDSLEGRHASLSASFRGRMGGRGHKAAPAVPLHFPNGL